MAHYGWLRWFIKLIQRLTAFTRLAPILQTRLWPDEVHFGLAAKTTSYHHNVCSDVKVGALLDVWLIVGGYGGI